MSSFQLEIEATSLFSGGNAPTLEILIGGVVVSSASMVNGTSTYRFLLDYTGNFPSSLQFRFNGASGDPGDSITFDSVQVNGQTLGPSDLTLLVLTQGQSSSVSTAANDQLFGRVEPSLGDLGAVTLTGTGGDDFLSGTENDDVIDLQGGNDMVFAGAGDDKINGAAGADTIFGQAGNDLVIAGAGDDLVLGGAGDDLIYGQADNDTLVGEDGNDTINGGAGNDGILGDAGTDVLFGEDGDDWLIGGAGDDTLYGDDGNDTLIGGADNDTMYGGNNDDEMDGDTGNDMMYGEAGNDSMHGAEGDDTIDGGAGNDEIFGEDGVDTISGGTGDDLISGGDGDDIIDGDGNDDTIIGGAGADTIDGGTGDDILQGHGLDAATISSILFNNPNVVYSQETGSFYEFVTSGATWTASQTAAASATLNGVNGHLATITSLEEVAFLDAQVNPTNNTSIGSYFASGSDADVADEWVFTDGIEEGIQFWQGQDAGSTVNNFDDMWVAGQPNSAAQNYVIPSFI